MPACFDRKEIIDTIMEHPEKARKLWISMGYAGDTDEIVALARRQGIPCRVLPTDVFLKRFRGEKALICLERGEVPYVEPGTFIAESHSGKDLLLCAFDGIYDPQNLGNIVRSTACLEVDGIILPKDRSCGITDAVSNVSKGGIDRARIARVVNIPRFIEELKKAGMFCYGLDEKGDKPVWEIDLAGPVCLVFGSEDGLKRLTKKRCDGIARIPTSPDFPSLNVATSVALAVYEARRQRCAAEIRKGSIPT